MILKRFKNVLYFWVALTTPLLCYSQAWNQIGSGTTASIGSLTFPTNDTGYFLTSNNQVKKTVNGGLSWSNLPIPSNHLVTSVKFYSSLLGYITTDSANMSNLISVLFRTTDGGSSWTRMLVISMKFMNAPELVNNTIILLPVINYSNDTMFLYRSSDSGFSWNIVRIDQIGSIREAVNFYSPMDGYYFVGNSMFSSNDSGITWVLRSNSFSLMNGFWQIHMPSSDSVYAQSGTELYSSLDNGNSWNLKSTPAYLSYDGYFWNGLHGTICVGNSPGTIRETVDGGTTWSIVYSSSDALTDMDFPTDTVGYCGGTNGILLKYTLAGVGITEISSSIDFILFPNPAKESITLKDLPLHAQIKLLDANGKLLLSEKSESAEVTLDTHTCAAGIYFVEVSNGKNVTRKKVVLQ